MAPLGSDLIARLGFEQLVRSAPVAISVIDARGRVIYRNQHAEQLAVRQRGAKAPVDLEVAVDIFHPDGRRYEHHEWPAVRSIATGEEISGEEFFYVLPDGGRLPIRCNCSPVRDQDGQIVAAVLAMNDITEQKDREERLREAQEQRALATRRLDDVREAERSRIARDLHDDALQELVDALNQADRGRSAGLSPEAAEQLASSLRRVNEHLRGAIHGLRLSDEMSGRFPDTLAALVEVHRAVAAESEIDLVVQWESPTGPTGDRGLEILRIVGEALTNARRHSHARHIRVHARGTADRLRLEVTDDGRGFDPDETAVSTSGLGLKGMRERAAVLGAGLEIRSVSGAGTTIQLEVDWPPEQNEQPATRGRILLVEDNAATREAIAYLLAQEADLEIVGQAASLAEARGMLRDIDVAIIDLGLPDGDGEELIHELHDASPNARALILSASLDPAKMARARESGAAATIEKAASFNKLVDTVQQLRRGA